MYRSVWNWEALGSHCGSEILRRTLLLPPFRAAISSGSFRFFVLTVAVLLVSWLLHSIPPCPKQQERGRRRSKTQMPVESACSLSKNSPRNPVQQLPFPSSSLSYLEKNIGFGLFCFNLGIFLPRTK